MKSQRALERIVRGFSNHRRIQMLGLLHETPELTLKEVAARLRINLKTAADHLRRLTIAGLALKRNRGAAVQHRLTERGTRVLTFLQSLE